MYKRQALLIGDEPTSALDVTTQSQVVMQMMELSKVHNSAIVMVTHNLGVAAYMSDYIIVMKKGCVVDAGTPQEILENPSNEYTKQLKDAVPTLEGCLLYTSMQNTASVRLDILWRAMLTAYLSSLLISPSRYLP